MVKLQAHRGVSSEFPENTIVGFQAAVDQGYDLIECDPKFTKDGQIVILHDGSLNRTGRKANGEALTEEVKIKDVTLAQARELEYGSWLDPKFRGEPIPTLEDALDFAERTKIPFKFDNVWETFPEDIQDKFMDQIAARGDKVNVGFTCRHLATLKKAADRFPNADLHYDGGDLSAERLEEVAKIAKGHHLYIWVCFDNKITTWFKGSKATAELCAFVRQYGEMGIWILSKREELEPAIREFHAQVIETTGHIKPQWVREMGE